MLLVSDCSDRTARKIDKHVLSVPLTLMMGRRYFFCICSQVVKTADCNSVSVGSNPTICFVQCIFIDLKKGKNTMLEIKGKVNTAICYASVIEEEAIEQIRRMCDYEFTAGSKVRIMPDVHAGKGCTIGTTMTVIDKAVPNVVGVDIGCGMYTVNLGNIEIDFEKLDEACHFVPSGMNVWQGRQEHFDLQQLRCFRELKDSKRLERSLGTLGGGNHFIEVDKAADGTKYLVIHTGSRNLGKQVAEIYQRLAVDLNRGMEDYFEQRDEIIRTLKAQGRRSEIQAVLKEIA